MQRLGASLILMVHANPESRSSPFKHSISPSGVFRADSLRANCCWQWSNSFSNSASSVSAIVSSSSECKSWKLDGKFERKGSIKNTSLMLSANAAISVFEVSLYIICSFQLSPEAESSMNATWCWLNLLLLACFETHCSTFLPSLAISSWDSKVKGICSSRQCFCNLDSPWRHSGETHHPGSLSPIQASGINALWQLGHKGLCFKPWFRWVQRSAKQTWDGSGTLLPASGRLDSTFPVKGIHLKPQFFKCSYIAMK